MCLHALIPLRNKEMFENISRVIHPTGFMIIRMKQNALWTECIYKS